MDMDKDILNRAIARVGILKGISDSPDFLQRTFLSKANRAAAECVMAWMKNIGMVAAHDKGGTVRGVLAGRIPGEKAFLIGSHIDTVIDAGSYDGALGVICGLAALEQILSEGLQLDFPVHLLGFSDEEGVRFQSTYLGSAAVIGGLTAEMLAVRDTSGRTVSEIFDNEGWHEGAQIFHYDEFSSSGYLELHIEQGRVLEEAREPVAIVTGIAGQARLRICVGGLADHAGTTPMDLRKDALSGAAEMILSTERIAKNTDALVATVGMIKVRPGASNAIVQTADFTVDMRHPDDLVLNSSLAALRDEMEEIATCRGLEIIWEIVQLNGAVSCDAGMMNALMESTAKVTGTGRLLSSGAGHDGVMMSRVMPIGMIFVRCRAGLSHHPDEYAEPDDIEVAIQVMVDFLKTKKK